MIRAIAEKLGILTSPEIQAEMDLKNQRMAEETKRYQELEKQRRDALSYSNACLGKIEYVLGLSEHDPHPNEPIVFHPDHPWPTLPQPNQDPAHPQ